MYHVKKVDDVLADALAENPVAAALQMAHHPLLTVADTFSFVKKI